MPTNAEIAQQVTALQAEIAALRAAQADQAQANPQGNQAQAQAPVAARRAPLLDPHKGLLGLLPQFDGMPGADFREWITTFEKVLATMKLAAEEKMTLIPILLTDHATDVFSSLTATEKADFETLKTTLADKFVMPQHLTNSLFQLFDHKQKVYETVSEYGVALRKLGRKAYPDKSEAELGTSLTELFVRGILPTLQASLVSANPASLTEAISIAQWLESL
ncbi:MAG: hypothetical protein GY832_27620, partial [Chloroflexi bacterium]|nr:hypothetical protein [Chloroflexota bacterium]